MNERRKTRRYDLSLPVQVKQPMNREAVLQVGQTRDISTRGVYFTTRKELSLGSEVDFTLTLPAEITPGADVFVRAHGRIVRVDRPDEEEPLSIGVAAIIERYDIVRSEQASG